MSKDYYNILGVAKDASADDVKRAFRKKAHEFHPDKSTGDEKKFKEINEAYQILGNEGKRKQYDQFGDAAFSGQGFGGTGMGWEDFVRQAQQGGFGSAGGGQWGGVQFDFGDLGDMFGDMFGFGARGRGRGRETSRRGGDIQIDISIDFMDAIFGTERTVRIGREAVCKTCHGNGAEPGTPIIGCERCGGSGQIVHARATILGNMQTASMCPECHGEGKKAEKPCSDCGGAGKRHESNDMEIAIPSGIDGGQSIRITGKGHAGIRGGEAGDLYVRVRVKQDKRFERDNDMILSEQHISIAQAALGDSIDVGTVHGAVSLKIPPGTESGKVFKLRGKGVPHVHDNGTGDHLVHIVVDIPSKLSRKQRKLFEELKNTE